MKHLVLTGIATELDVQSGRTSYSLIFNGGELHLPVQEAAVETALAAMMSDDDPTEAKEEPRIDWAAADIQARAEAGENHEDYQPASFYVEKESYLEISPGPSEEDIAAVVAGQHQGWESNNGQLPLDPADRGAEIFSATDDYAQPPPPMSSGVEEIDDGVAQL